MNRQAGKKCICTAGREEEDHEPSDRKKFR